MSSDGIRPLEPVRPDSPTTNPDTPAARTSAARSTEADEQYERAEREVETLEALRRRIEKALAAKGYLNDVSLKIDERGLSISLVSRHIVFRANEADLSPRGTQVLDVLAPVIRSLPNQVDVDGHTNQVKVKPKYYPTDWELSSARANAVLQFMLHHGVRAKRLSTVGYGDQNPMAPNRTAAGRSTNRRVDLVLLRRTFR
jgi:chemotaxis protein MotB